MTIHQSAIDRMKREGMTELAAETVRRAIADTDDELTATRADIAMQRARLDQDDLYAAGLDQRLTALRARLRQLEAS